MKVGDLAPSVKLKDQTGELRDVAAEYGRRWVALTFYPKDNTPGCTREAISLTTHLDELSAAGIAVYGISVQDVESKQAFCAAHNLKHPLLCDVDHQVCQAYGTLRPDGISMRVTYVLDPARIVRVVDKQVNVDNHATDLLKIVDQLRAEDEQAGRLATLKQEPLDTGLGLRLCTPEGWHAGLAAQGGAVTWSSEALPGVALSLATLPPQPDTLSVEAMTAKLPQGFEARGAEELPVGGRPGVRIDGWDRGQDPPRYVTGVRWIDGEHDFTLSLAAPPDKADAAARLLASIVATIGSGEAAG